VVEIEFGAFEP